MEGVLWYLLASSRGGPTRVRILRAIDERPRNANQLANALDLDYTTVRHHLDVLLENNVVRTGGEEYATVYLFTDQVRSNWDTVEEILDTVDPAPDEDDGDAGTASGDDAGAGTAATDDDPDSATAPNDDAGAGTESADDDAAAESTDDAESNAEDP